jgi:fused signal recognition particle receptor
MEIVYVLLVLAVLGAVYFLFFKKAEPERLPGPPAERKLPERREQRREKAEPEKARVPEREGKREAREAEPISPAEAAADEFSVDSEEPLAEPVRPSISHVRDVAGLRRGLAKSRGEEGFFGRLKALLGAKREISPEIAADVEEVLLSSDVGVQATETILNRVRDTLGKSDLVDSSRVWDALREEARRILACEGKAGAFSLRGTKPTVVLMVGVNGAGKTTTIGKLATKLRAENHTCVLAAADTFRAAAVQQLVVWGQRVGCEVVHGKDGADPGSVVFDAIKRAQEIGADVVLADTAGRLHTKANLMAEMEKIVKTAGKAMPGAPHEVLLVIDATNGQNALAQAREFKDALPLTGIVLTKLDGTAKGGVILGISDTLSLPVRFIGLGERPDDLHDFSPDEFVEALLGKEAEASAA